MHRTTGNPRSLINRCIVKQFNAVVHDGTVCGYIQCLMGLQFLASLLAIRACV